ncbi:molybdopterin molybdotransferase MoeA [soil metagenome]
MSLPTVEAAQAAMLETIRPLDAESVPLAQADDRWLAEPVLARRDQPPFHASAMDGWAVRAVDVVEGARLAIVGESAAGHGNEITVGAGQAARIFTGAALPAGADHVVIQEEAVGGTGHVTLQAPRADMSYVRPRGGDFRQGQVLLEMGVRLNPWRLALAASAGCSDLVCARRPRVAILPTGDELVEAGGEAGPHQIYDAGGAALVAFAARRGAVAERLRPARDQDADVIAVVEAATFDLLVTIGGASVGDHDRIKPALRAIGAELTVEGCAMRPGKPVWFATLPGGRWVLGLPGNPASALVCAELFLAPLVMALQGGQATSAFETAFLAEPLAANGPRDHYMRATMQIGADGLRRVRPFPNQDSSLVTVMASATTLIRRRPGAQAAFEGDTVEILPPGH